MKPPPYHAVCALVAVWTLATPAWAQDDDAAAAFPQDADAGPAPIADAGAPGDADESPAQAVDAGVAREEDADAGPVQAADAGATPAADANTGAAPAADADIPDAAGKAGPPETEPVIIEVTAGDEASGPAEPATAEAATGDGGAPISPAEDRAPADQEDVVEVTVVESRAARALRRSSRAVTVVDTTEARRESADLGEVVGRASGVTVQRAGGLGSDARLSLNGLSAEQVRVFLDGVPLDLTGFPMGLANVPVDFVDRVDIYRGVVPARLGADALGGAIELISEEDLHESRDVVSYQTGSFDTHRAAVLSHHVSESSGTFARARAFLDHTRNDYLVDVEALDEAGNAEPIRARRFHDAYRGWGVGATVGLLDRPRAERLSLEGFYSDADSDVQSSRGMSVPFGEVVFSRRSTGAKLRFDQAFASRARVSLIAGYAFLETTFRDVGDCRYGWLGRCVSPLRNNPGEADLLPHDQVVKAHSPYLRLETTVLLAPDHVLRLVVAPTYQGRTGNDAAVLPGEYDPLDARRRVFSGMASAEYEATLFDGRLENTLFVKGYTQALTAREELPSGALRDVREAFGLPGAGDSLRWLFTDAIYAKASYEYATRLPTPDELFGNGVEILENFHLTPEVSHNANLGLTAERLEVGYGHARLDVNGFLRRVDDQIVLLGNGSWFNYDNVRRTRSLGVESSAGWTSPHGYLALDGTFTYQDLRNVSESGPFSDHEGERMPNRPYLFADAHAQLAWPRPFTANDRLTFGYRMHWVHAFLFEWARLSTGDVPPIPTQLTHTLVAAYELRRGERAITASIEATNLTDAQVFDLYGTQRPGRAAYAKLSLTL